MSVLSMLIIAVSFLNDILDFGTAYFPGVNEVITFMFSSVIMVLVFFETIQKKAAGAKGVGAMALKKMLALLLAALLESFPLLGLLPLQTGGAVVMALIKPREKRVDQRASSE